MARTSWPGVPDLPEGEGVSLGAGAGERDLEGALGDGPVLPDELVQSLLGEGAGAVVVHVGSVIGPGGCPSRSTLNRVGVPGAAGPMTTLRSRAWNRQAIRPSAVSSLAASSWIVQSPARAQWLSLSSAGAV